MFEGLVALQYGNRVGDGGGHGGKSQGKMVRDSTRAASDGSESQGNGRAEGVEAGRTIDNVLGRACGWVEPASFTELTSRYNFKSGLCTK
jgi:hypothetical protein